MKRVVLAIVGSMILAAPAGLRAQAQPDERRVLVIGAHPDDEDNQIIAWLDRGGNARTAYLSLTRGDGGQNLIGNELGEALGVIRTQELLAARRVDGADQYFTRAYDFGFSKSAEETYRHWPKDSLLNDVVKVVRAFRPQIIIAIFSGTPRDGHGAFSGFAVWCTVDSIQAVSRCLVQFQPGHSSDKCWRVQSRARQIVRGSGRREQVAAQVAGVWNFASQGSGVGAGDARSDAGE